MALGLFLAVIVNQKIRGQTFFRAAFYFPAIASSAAITVLWLFIFAPAGLFNDVREALGLNPLFEAFGFGPNHNWIGTSNTALNTIIALNVWTTSGTFMLFYLASLQTISKDIYEAAAIDGAGAWQRSAGSRSRCSGRPTSSWRRCGHRRPPDVRPGVHRWRAGRRRRTTRSRRSCCSSTARRSPTSTSGSRRPSGVVLFVIIFSATLVQRRLFGQTPTWY